MEDTRGRKKILTIEKRTEYEKDDGPAITYCISTDQDQAFRVRLQERIPEGYLPADFDFDSWYHADDWTIRDETVVFERRIEPESEVSTLFSVRLADTGDLGSLVEPPSVEIAPVETDVEGTDTSWVEVPTERIDFRIADEDTRTDSVKAVASDGGEPLLLTDDNTHPTRDEHSDGELPETESRSPGSLDSAIPTVSGPEAAGEDGTTTTNETEAVENVDAPDGNQPRPEESIVDDLITALQQESISESQKQTLREVMGSDSVVSMNARIEHCQTRLSDLAAYTDAFEEFLDEEGTGRQLITEFQSDLESVEDHLEALESEVAQTANGQDDLRERVDEMERDVSALREIGHSVESLETRLDETTTSLQDELDELRTSIEDIEDWQESIVGAFVDAELVEEA